MQQDTINPEEIKQTYFQIKSSAVEHLRDLIHELKWNKSSELNEKIKELEQELENLKNTKKYWLVWDNEKEVEQVVLDCQRKLPILKEKKERKILNDESWESNILIQWDNYHALQVLNYTHKESIDVIYIDPPYNTWNKDFIYNDKYIDKEDTYRHSKWLNFMSKRLELAYDLLKEDWVIFISIDDNEQAQLKLLCDEIFWEENFVWNMIIETATDNNPRQLSISHEYFYIFCKNKNIQKKWIWESIWALKIEEEYILLNNKFGDNINKIQIELRKWIKSNKDILNKVSHYSSVDKKWVYYWDNPSNTKEWWYTYNVFHPLTNKICSLPTNWFRFPEKTFMKMVENWDIEFWKDELTIPKPKRRLENVKDLLRSIYYEDWRVSTNLLNDIFWKKVFNNPKSINLLKHVFSFLPNTKSSLILDFFAWSWTTWHAVLDLNKEDWGNRKFILCTNNENNICEEITYERIKRVSNWYTNSKWNEIPWLWGNLRYYETEFVEVENLSDIDDEKKLELTYNAGELLAIKEWIYNELEKNSYWQIFESNKNIVAVYFKETAENINEMVERLAQIQKQKWWKVVWYIYWNPYKKETFKKIKNLELKDIPDPILKVYREINKV